MYKASDYNYFVPYKDNFIYYNSLRDSIFLLSRGEHREMQRLFADPISFDLENSHMFQEFYTEGFFVDLCVNELTLFRYRYGKEVINNSKYHLAIITTEEHELSHAFIELLKKHVAHVLNSQKIDGLCIEWYGVRLLSNFETYILPVFEYAQTLCSSAGLPIRNQINISLSNSETVYDNL